MADLETPQSARQRLFGDAGPDTSDPWFAQVAETDKYGHTVRPGKIKVRAPDGTLGTIPEDKRQDAISRGLKILGPDQRVRGFFGKDTVTVPPERLQEAMKSGFVPMTQEEAAGYEDKQTIKEKFDMPGTAFLAHGVNAAGLGIPLAAAGGLGAGKRSFDEQIQAHSPEEVAATQKAALAYRAMFGEGYNPDDTDPRRTAAFEALRQQARNVRGSTKPEAPPENEFEQLAQGQRLMTGANRKSSIAGEIAGMFTPGPSAVMGAARGPAAAAATEKAVQFGQGVARLTGSWKMGLAAEKAAQGAAGEAAAGGSLALAQAPAKLSETPLGPESFWSEVGSAAIFTAVSGALGGVLGAAGSALATRGQGIAQSPGALKLKEMIASEHAASEAQANNVAKRMSALQWAEDNKELVNQHPDIKASIQELALAKKQLDVPKYTKAELQLKIDLHDAADMALGDLLPPRVGEAQRGVGSAPWVHQDIQHLYDLADNPAAVKAIIAGDSVMRRRLRQQFGPGATIDEMANKIADGIRPGIVAHGGTPGRPPSSNQVFLDAIPEGKSSGLGFLGTADKIGQEAGTKGAPHVEPSPPGGTTLPESAMATGPVPAAPGGTNPGTVRAMDAQLLPRQANQAFPVGGWQDLAEQNVNDVMSLAADKISRGETVSYREVLNDLLESSLHGRDAEAISSIASKTAEHLEALSELRTSGTTSVSQRVGYLAGRAAHDIGDRLDKYYSLRGAIDRMELPFPKPTPEQLKPMSPVAAGARDFDLDAQPSGTPAELEAKLAEKKVQAGTIGQAFEAEAAQAKSAAEAAQAKSAAEARAAGDPAINAADQRATAPPEAPAAADVAPKGTIFGSNLLADLAHSAIGAAFGGFGGAHGAMIVGGGTFATRVIRRYFGSKLHSAVKDLPDVRVGFLKAVDQKISSIFAKGTQAAAGAKDSLKEGAQALKSAASDVGKAAVETVAPKVPTLVGRLAAANYGEDKSDGTSLPHAAQAKADAISKLASNPKATEAQIGNALAPLRMMDPTLVEGAVKHFMERINFLNTKLPKTPVAPPLSGTLELPSHSQAARFARYVVAAENPADTILDGIHSGDVWPEAVETIQKLYPNLDEALRMRFVGAAVKHEKTLPYAQRQAMASTFGPALNPIRDPQFTSWYLQTMAQANQDRQEQEKQPGDAGGYMPKRKIDFGSETRGTLGQRLGA